MPVFSSAFFRRRFFLPTGRGIICLAAYLGIITPLLSQNLWKFKYAEVWVKGIARASTPLPDSFKTFRVIAKIDPDAQSLSTESEIESRFRWSRFEKTNENANLTVAVQIHAYRPSGALQTDRDTSGQNRYFFSEKIEPQITGILYAAEGLELNRLSANRYAYYKTPPRSTEIEARKDYARRTFDPAYLTQIRNAYQQTLDAWAETLGKRFDDRDELVYLYYPSKNGFEYLKHIESIRTSLKKINRNAKSPEILAEMIPGITFFSDKLSALGQPSRKKRYEYIALCLNLAQIYRCVEDYPNARRYLRLASLAKPYEVEPLIHNIARQFDAYQAGLYYKKWRKEYEAVRRDTLIARMAQLEQLREAEGRLILSDGKEIAGTFLDLIPNYKENKLKLKYEKKLNAAPEALEYAVADIAEIKLSDRILRNIRYNKRFYLAETVRQSPNLTLCRTLPGMGVTGLLNRTPQDAYFVRKSGESEFSSFSEEEISALGKYLNDCENVSLPARFGFYTSLQFENALADYDTLCGRGGEGEAPPVKKKYTANPGFFWGLGTGANYITSIFGVTAAARFFPGFYSRFGLGIGFWGPKVSAGIKYDFKKDMRYSKGWSASVWYAQNLGGVGPLNLSISSTSGGQTTNAEANIYPESVGSLNFSVIFNKFRGNRKAWLFEFGYSVAFRQKAYSTDADPGSLESVQPTIRLAHPGGLIIGISRQFGI